MIKNNEALTEITKYNITLLRNKGFIDKNINIGDIASIDVSKIPSKSHYKVIAICEICNTKKELPYHKYTRNHNNCGFYTCNTCIHDYNEPFFNPDTIREAYGYNMVGHGSDVWYEPQGYRDVKVDRWTRVCKICGNSQHTNKLEPVIKDII